MTAIIVIKRDGRRSLLRWLLPGFRGVTQERKEVGEQLFQYLLCEAELPERPGKRCYARVKRQIVEVLTRQNCRRILLYDPAGTALRRELEECGFEIPDAGALKHLLFEKLLDFAIERRGEMAERAALVDYEGNFQSEELLSLLCRKFRYVTLITANPSYFERTAERIMEEMGLAVQITGEGESECHCGIYVLVSGGERTLYRYAKNRNNIVLCMSEENQTNFIGLRNVLRQPVVRLPQELMCDFPAEITDTQAAELMAAERVEGLTEALEIVGSY